jgi:hypothetical protein
MPAARRSSPDLEEVQEWVLPLEVHRDRVPVVTSIRSTLISSSLQAVRDRDLMARYTTLLPREHHEIILRSIAGTWLPLDAGFAHYRAMDGLQLGSMEIVEVGRSVAEKVQGSVLSSLAKLATGSGVTPWVAIGQMHRLWARVFVGGAVAVAKRGPKEVSLEVHRNPLFAISYFRGAFRGLIAEGLGLFCTKAYVTEVARWPEAHRIVFKCAWA